MCVSLRDIKVLLLLLKKIHVNYILREDFISLTLNIFKTVLLLRVINKFILTCFTPSNIHGVNFSYSGVRQEKWGLLL